MPDDVNPAASVQDVLGNSGTLPTVTWNDETYHLSFPTQKAKAALEELVAAQAVNECRAVKGSLPPDAYAELWNETVKAIQTREHRTLGPLWNKTVMGGGVASAALILLVLFRVKHPALTEAGIRDMIRDEPEQTTAALLRVIPSFFEMVGRDAGVKPEALADLTTQLRATLSPPAGPSREPNG